MKNLSFEQMEQISGGFFSDCSIGCGLLGLAAGIASGMNPLIGGLTTAGCMLTSCSDSGSGSE